MNLQLLQSSSGQLPECGIQALNMLGKSILNNTMVNCVKVFYDLIDNTTNITNVFHIENYQTANPRQNIVTIKIYAFEIASHVKIVLSKTNFTNLKAES